MSLNDLKKQLKEAIEKEDYENASRLRDEINKGKKIKISRKIYYPILVCLGLILLNSCQENSTNEMLVGKWEFKEVVWQDGSSEYVPDNERHVLNIQVFNNKNQFNVDNVRGEWKLEDPYLI